MHGGGLRVGIGPPPAAEGLDDVDEPAVVLDPPLGAARLLLLLLLGVNLGRLAADFTGTGEGSVNLSTLERDVDVDGADPLQAVLGLERAAGGVNVPLKGGKI